jgi:hypothetical protein
MIVQSQTAITRERLPPVARQKVTTEPKVTSWLPSGSGKCKCREHGKHSVVDSGNRFVVGMRLGEEKDKKVLQRFDLLFSFICIFFVSSHLPFLHAQALFLIFVFRKEFALVPD